MPRGIDLIREAAAGLRGTGCPLELITGGFITVRGACRASGIVCNIYGPASPVVIKCKRGPGKRGLLGERTEPSFKGTSYLNCARGAN